MMPDAHPPIPPGSKYFRKRTDGGYEIILAAMAMPLSERMKTWRDLIAKVAAQEWQDEAERLTEEFSKKSEDYYKMPIDGSDAWVRRMELHRDQGAVKDRAWILAMSNARDWRKWGRGEWTP